jgi:hypothetical protein
VKYTDPKAVWENRILKTGMLLKSILVRAEISNFIAEGGYFILRLTKTNT